MCGHLKKLEKAWQKETSQPLARPGWQTGALRTGLAQYQGPMLTGPFGLLEVRGILGLFCFLISGGWDAGQGPGWQLSLGMLCLFTLLTLPALWMPGFFSSELDQDG
jgi:hypothetical protein